MSYHLIELVEQLGSPHVLVIGDLILDRYIWGDAERISQEAPVILLREDRQEHRLGGAANVAHMLRGLDAQVTLAGIVGSDEDGQIARAELERLGIDHSATLTDASRPTTVKIRFMGRAQYRHPHQMLRVDREVRTAISAELSEKLLADLLPKLPRYQAILISDYAKGVCEKRLLAPLIEAAKGLEIPVIVDPANHGNCSAYHGCTAATPNRLETSRATGLEVKTVEEGMEAAKRLCAVSNLDHAFVTLDRDGIVVGYKTGEAAHFPTRPREVCDITGAGDMVLAMIGVGAAAGIGPDDLAKLANVAGGLEVEQIGVVPISRRDILQDLLRWSRPEESKSRSGGKVADLDELRRHVSARRKAGQSIVLTNGCFDLLHVGHVTYLQEAAKEGDCLIVALNSDASVRRLEKGPDRPIFDEQYRAQMLAALEAVDFVVVFDEDTPHAVLEAIQPDVLVKGGTYSIAEIVGREVVEAYGGRVKAMGAVEGLSTTDIVRRLRQVSAPTLKMPSITMPERKAG
jgi:D-beta-D-heptose 7-phosphate kinase / D-beta-D-heptose 1-phosphate adenosyltransferase